MNEFKIGERINNNDNKYKFTNDQQKAIDGIIDFIASPFNPAKYIVGLIGAGGTGKTFITKYIINNCKYSNSVIKCTSSTHKACRVFSQAIGNRPVDTIQSTLGLRLDLRLEDFDPNNPQFNPMAKPKLDDIKLLLVDEASMLPSKIVNYICEQCKQLNIRDILVEKPFIVNKEFFEENDDLNIAMVHNYEYSKIVMKIKEYIVQKELKPVIIYTNFSKNRTEESFNGRGMYKKVTRNIEHDIPHQVYISQFLLDNPKDTQVLLEEEKTMERGNRILEKHGYSKIFTKKNDVYVIHESDFATNTKIREVIVICENNIVIKGEFLFYDKDLNKLKDGNVSIIQNNKVIHSEKIDFDDNMYECLLDIYKYFNTDVISQKYKDEIKDFSNEMNLYL